jgi:hypothetical protein
VAADSLRSPTDFSRMPTERDMFLNGRPEGDPNRIDPARVLETDGGGGVQGPRGYILK